MPDVTLPVCFSFNNVLTVSASAALSTATTSSSAPPTPVASVPVASASASAAAAEALDNGLESKIPPWAIVLALVAAGIVAFTFWGFVWVPACSTESDEDQDVEDAPPSYDYESIPFIDISAPAPVYSPNPHYHTEPPLDNGSTAEIPRRTTFVDRVDATRSRVHVYFPQEPDSENETDSSHSDSFLSGFPTPPSPPSLAVLPLRSRWIMLREQTSESLNFPIPGTYNPETKSYQTELIVIKARSVRVADLKELCNRFHKRPGQLRKAELEGWLRNFSAHPEHWAAQLEVGATNSHRNPRPMTKPGNVKDSTKQREIMFDSPADTAPLPRRPVTDRSRDERPAHEVARNIPWAKAFNQRNPYQPPAVRHRTQENAEASHDLFRAVLNNSDTFIFQPAATEAPVSIVAFLQNSRSEIKDLKAGQEAIKALLAQQTQPLRLPFEPASQRSSMMPELSSDPFARLPQRPSVASDCISSRDSSWAMSSAAAEASSSTSFSSAPTSVSAAGSAAVETTTSAFFAAPAAISVISQATSSAVAGTSTSLSSVPTSISSASVESSTPPSISSAPIGPLRSLEITASIASRESITNAEPLSDGLLFQQPAPPCEIVTLQFTEADIPEPPHYTFKGADELRATLPKIHGHPIALKYWNKVYRNLEGDKKQIWPLTKRRWGEWQYLYTLWEGSPNDTVFWADFPCPKTPGEVLSIAQVQLALRDKRKLEDTAHQAQAHVDYGPADGDTFKQFFTRRGYGGVTLSRLGGRRSAVPGFNCIEGQA
ncbi:hypothetical protein MSAN_01075900 [Mycena sanguinolenta]|uniref:SAP domain-containing protein n=1 Tax=Mycena sanguinolenta TaxID=230812 RepID=A0A8H7DA00_9AGAR|nr:hypothetical protein MSAN_01075900 [Mycena sanguinolenta]